MGDRDEETGSKEEALGGSLTQVVAFDRDENSLDKSGEKRKRKHSAEEKDDQTQVSLHSPHESQQETFLQ